ncbi:MAG TPA: toast rack family protein [Candidatus Dormibacteraeota bacterium]|nr:toast rack family protein [Candidatus Dormibacteraeota bacterium]
MTDTANMNPNPGPPPARPLVFPIILILIGALFLYANWKPGIDPWRIIGTYWPLILIFLGLGKLWDNTRGGSRQGYSGGLVLALLVVVVIIAVALSHGRSFRRTGNSSTHMEHSERTIAVSGAKDVRATVDMSAGELTIGSGAGDLLEASFDQRADMPPKVDYDRNGDTGVLKISEDDSGAHVVFPGNHDSHWNLRFGGRLPLDLKIDMGAGQGNLNLRGIPVTKLELSIGAGQVNADLTGERKQDLNADIEGGVGEAVIRLPRDIPVEVRASGGIGSIDTHGLKKQGDRYVNDAYGKPGPVIHLKVEGGVGHINLTQE